jgi:hypothetical protein
VLKMGAGDGPDLFAPVLQIFKFVVNGNLMRAAVGVDQL